MLAVCSVPGPELGAGDLATCSVWALPRTWSGGDQRPRNCGPSPVELVRGTGGGALAALENSEQGQSNLVGEGESLESPERKQFLSFSGGGKRQDLN